MSSFASLACYSALKELKDSKIDLITAYSRMIAPIILQNASKKNYDIYSIQKDVKNEYSLTIPYPAMQSILSKCHELGYTCKVQREQDFTKSLQTKMMKTVTNRQVEYR